MPLHVFVRFEPLPAKEQQLHDELVRLMEPTRAEPGCVRIHLYEAVRDPMVYCIHSEWVDAAAFDAHSQFPHMIRFLGLVRDLVPHPIQPVRSREIA